MAARKKGDRPGRRGGSTDKTTSQRATADRLRQAHRDDPEEIDIAIAETSANRLFTDRGPKPGGAA